MKTVTRKTSDRMFLQDFPDKWHDYARDLLLKERDSDNAIKWLEKGAIEGCLSSQRSLGILYLWRDRANLAKTWLTMAAEQGNIECAMLLVSHVLNAQNPEDVPVLQHWLNIAAKEHHPIACQNLGIYSYQGIFSDPDPVAALTWFQLAAPLESTSAIAAAIILEEDFPEIASPPSAAFAYWEQAANAGQPDAMIILADCYEQGHHVLVDPQKAKAWREKADNFNPELPRSSPNLDMRRVSTVLKQIYLGSLLSVEIPPVFEKIIPEITPKTLAETYQSINFSKTASSLPASPATEIGKRALYAAEAGEPEAQYFYGRLLLEGKDIGQNTEEALLWLKASAKSNANAQFFLAGLYRHAPMQIKADENEAAYWLEKAAENGIYCAKYHFAGIALERQQLEEGIKWFRAVSQQADEMEHYYDETWRKSYFGTDNPAQREHIENRAREKTQKGDLFAQLEMGIIYEHFALHDDLTPEQQTHYYHKAAEFYMLAQNHLTARYRLGLLYLNGLGVNQNDTLAFDHFLEASRNWSEIKDYQKEFIPVMGLPYRLGYCYEKGVGTAANAQMALEWYYKGARNMLIKTVQPEDDFWANPRALILGASPFPR